MPHPPDEPTDSTPAPRLVVTPGTADANLGADYTDDELQFLRAIVAYKQRRKRPFPTWREVLAIARSLGYRRVAEPTALPVPEVHVKGGRRKRDE